MTNTPENVKSFIMEDVKEMKTILRAREHVKTCVDQVIINIVQMHIHIIQLCQACSDTHDINSPITE